MDITYNNIKVVFEYRNGLVADVRDQHNSHRHTPVCDIRVDVSKEYRGLITPGILESILNILQNEEDVCIKSIDSIRIDDIEDTGPLGPIEHDGDCTAPAVMYYSIVVDGTPYSLREDYRWF